MTNDYFTTMRELRRTTSEKGAVVRYGDKVFRVDGNEHDGYTVEVYEFPDMPCELGYPEDECKLECIAGIIADAETIFVARADEVAREDFFEQLSDAIPALKTIML